MKTKRKFLSALFVLCLLFTLLPMTTLAAENEVDTWDGTADTSWFDSSDVKDSYEIATAEQLAGLAKIVNSGEGADFAGKTFYLQKDLDLGGHEWTAIGNLPTASDGTAFYGNFDGQGHEIKNMTTTTQKVHNQLGLFGGVTGGTISNLHVTDATVVNTEEMYAGILACQASQATIISCSVSGTLTTTPLGGSNVGGMIGLAQGSTNVIGCSSSATIIDYVTKWTGHAIGGIIGAWAHTDNQDGFISDCYFNGKILFSEDSNVEIGQSGLTGGILGYHYISQNGTGDVVLNNCMTATSQIENAYTKSGEGNPPTWIMYNTESGAPQNCYWPDSADNWPPAVINLESNPTIIDTCGSSVKDFKDIALLEALKANAHQNVNWVIGIKHPTFDWDEQNIPANYKAVEEAVKTAQALNAELYTNYADVTQALEAVDWNKSKLEQAEVDKMAQDILDAVSALEYKPASYDKVTEAIKKAEALNKDEYTDFSKVEAAINSVVYGKNITEQDEVDAMAKAIEEAITALEKKPVQAEPDKNISSAGEASSPHTGDSSNLPLWITVMLTAAIVCIGTMLYIKKRHHKTK